MTLVRPELHKRFDTKEVKARKEKKERNGSKDAADGVALVIRKRHACDTLYISCQTGQRHYFKMACGSLGIILLPFLCSNWFNFSLSFLKGRKYPIPLQTSRERCGGLRHKTSKQPYSMVDTDSVIQW